MATYNNQHWLLSHIRNSFISTDDTGMCEAVMLSDDLPMQFLALHRINHINDKNNENNNNNKNQQQQQQQGSSAPQKTNESHQLKTVDIDDFHYYPGLELNDDEDLDQLSQSYDIQMVSDIGVYPRVRTNTDQKLEKLELARKRASKIKNIKYDDNIENIHFLINGGTSSNNDDGNNNNNNNNNNNLNNTLLNLFQRKNVIQQRNDPTSINGKQLQKSSRLAYLIEHFPKPPVNVFSRYARFDGTGLIGVPLKTIKIFLTMLPECVRNYPMEVCVLGTARIQDFIGLICFKSTFENPGLQLQKNVHNYGLYIAEEDGEIDLEFPALDFREPCEKFCFRYLALIERRPSDVGCTSIQSEGADSLITTEGVSLTSPTTTTAGAVAPGQSATTGQIQFLPTFKQSEDLERMSQHAKMMEATMYNTYCIQMITKGIFKMDIQLGVSGEKLEIDPVQQKNTKFWLRQKAISHTMDSITWCQILDSRQSRQIVRIIYCAVHQQQQQQQQHPQQSHHRQPHPHQQIKLSSQPQSSHHLLMVGAVNQQQQLQSDSLQSSPVIIQQQHQQHQQQHHHHHHHQQQQLHTNGINCFKHYDFETDRFTANDIVQKINYIIEVRSNVCRREYLAIKDKRKGLNNNHNNQNNNGKKSFSLR